MNIRFILLCFLALFISMMLRSSTYGYVQESQIYYHERLFDKTYSFTPSPDEIVVVFEDNVDYYDFQNRFQLGEARRLSRKHGIGVYKVPEGMVAGSLIDQLTGSPFVRKAAPAYNNQEGITIYCIPTELTVRFKRDVSEARMIKIVREIGSEVVRKQRTPGYFTISAPDNKGYFETIRLLYTYEETKFAGPAAIFGIHEAWEPNDYYFESQWNLKNTGQKVYSCDCDDPFDIHDIDAVSGWDIGRGDPDVLVVTIDTGMDLTHPDLAGNLLPRNGEDWDFADHEETYEGRSPDDEYHDGHGTACCGVAVAIANNDEGVAGVANLCRIMPLRIDFNESPISDFVDAIDYAKLRRPDFDGLVLSCSWGSDIDFTDIHDAMVEAYENEVLIVCAAGNSNGEVGYPAAYPETMAVGATSPCDERCSTTDPVSCDHVEWEYGSNYGPELDCAAPGSWIFTTDIQDDGQHIRGLVSGNYNSAFGRTSGACPHVAGVAAAVWAINTSLTNVQVRDIVNQTSDQVGGYDYDPNTGKCIELGHGRVNLYGAVCSAWDGVLSGPVYDGNGGPLRPECTIYSISGAEDPYVPDGQILNMEDGVEVYFDSNRKITALGELVIDRDSEVPNLFYSNEVEGRGIRFNQHLIMQNGGEIQIH